MGGVARIRFDYAVDMAISREAQRVESQAALARYSRQVLVRQIGAEGQRALARSSASLIGCGALGSGLANLLVRAGLGRLRLIDRDFIELNNLQRQTLFDEQDIADQLPKAEAAARRLRAINSDVRIEPVVADVTHANIESLIDGTEVVLDGTDNLETRYLINDACVKQGRPWVYGACIGVTGMMMPVLPGETACLRCVWNEPSPPGTSETCDTAGVLGPVVDLVASWQAIEALKLLTGRRAEVQRRLLQFDAWSGDVQWFDLGAARDAEACICCAKRQFEFLEGKRGSGASVICGRDAVQITPPAGARIQFAEIAARVAGVAAEPPSHNRFLMRFQIGPHVVTLFADGRAIIQGTSSPDEARSLYARYVGV